MWVMGFELWTVSQIEGAGAKRNKSPIMMNKDILFYSTFQKLLKLVANTNSNSDIAWKSNPYPAHMCIAHYLRCGSS